MTGNNVKDVHVAKDDVPWKIFREGIHFKLLRTCSVTGTWVVLFRHEAGTAYLPHKHIGAGEYFVLKGRVELRRGVENGGITATAGDYGYEPNGIVHNTQPVLILPCETISGSDRPLDQRQICRF